MATYLVTGGAGFIGSHLVEQLLSQGHAVRVLDDLSTGLRANLPAAAELMLGDVADPAAVAAAMAGCDGVFHLAAVASVQRATEDWLGAHRTNLTGSIVVLDAARAAGRLPVVYASSAAVYGDCAELPLSEAAPTHPLTAYGADKLGTEQHARVAWVVHQVPSVGLRFFNVFGPRQDPQSPYSGVISIFAKRVACGQPVVVHGDGEQTRDFIFVADVVQHLAAAMAVLASSPAALVCNVCTGRAVSVLALAHALAETTGQPLHLQHQPGRCGDIRHSRGDATLARQVLGAAATTTLEAGLAATLRGG